MAKLSRFQHLEHERPVRHDGGAPSARFEPEASTHPNPTQGPPLEPLQRFERPDEDAVRLDQADLARLPVLECGRCGTENGKFELTCATCGGRLDSPETVARNLPRLAQLDDQTRAERTAAEARTTQAVADAAARRAEQRQLAESLAREVRWHHRPLSGGALGRGGALVLGPALLLGLSGLRWHSPAALAVAGLLAVGYAWLRFGRGEPR